jgi:hypothetical protein
VRAPLIIVLALVLAACGSVPQPFRGAPKVTSDNPVLDVPAATGVEILPVAGLPPDLSDALGEAVAAGLLALEVPAAAVPAPGRLGFVLSGQAETAVSSPSGSQYQIAWTLRTRAGKPAGRFAQSVNFPAEGELPRPAGEQTAAQVAAAMGLVDARIAAAVPEAAPAPALPSVSIKPIEAAPGDGRESLRLAVLQALTDAGVRRDDVDPDITLIGRIDARPYDYASQQVAISWRAVLRDGRELGVVTLENVIPVGALDGAWGPTAFAIATAAQPDLLRLIASMPTS